MKGIVDDELRTLVDVKIGPTASSLDDTIRAWIDTAFNGGLVLSQATIKRVGLQEYSSTPAILADGSEIDLPTYTCYLEWFDAVYRTQVVANDGEYPLLGTMLLADRDLAISYRRKTVSLD